MRLVVLAIGAAFSLCAASALAAPPQRSFNTAAFAGLASPDIPPDGNALLAYDLDGANGQVIHFTSCRQAAETRQEAVRTDQFPLWKLLTLNCVAASKYAASRAAQRSYFPAGLTRQVVAAFPADSVPDIGGGELQRRAGRTLERYEQRLRITVNRDGTAQARTADADLGYTLIARADFDGDGLEDWLLRSQWSPRGARGSGADLVLLSRKKSRGRIVIAWRP